MYLVTGATGQLGSAVVRHLLKKTSATEIAVLVRDEAKAASLKEQGLSIRVGDYTDVASLENAFKGIDTLLLISSSDLNDRFTQHKNAIDAAVKAGVKHIVYTGVSMKDHLNSSLAQFMDSHYQTEEYIKASGITYTFFQNSLYAEVIPMFLGADPINTGVFIPAGDGKVPYVVREDIAEALANVLTSKGHENKTYAITNTELYSYADVAATLSEVAGKQVPYISPDKDTFFSTLKGFGVPDMYIGMSYGFGDTTKHRHFELVDASLEKLLGRKPVALATYLKSVYGK